MVEGFNHHDQNKEIREERSERTEDKQPDLAWPDQPEPELIYVCSSSSFNTVEMSHSPTVPQSQALSAPH